MAARKPTGKQIEAYMLTEVYRHPISGLRLRHEDAAKIMGVCRSNVTLLLLRLKNNHPILFQRRKVFDKPARLLHLDLNRHENKVVKKF